MGKLRYVLYAGMALASSILSAQAQTQQKPLILITGFIDAQKGLPGNRSIRVAKLLEKKSSKYEVSLCGINSYFEVAADQVIQCYQNLGSLKPAMVISLGQGPCQIHVERQAKNYENNLADNHNVNGKNGPIITNDLEYRPSTLPIDALVEGGSRSERIKVVASNDAGSYICNDVFYLMAKYFEHTKVPYGFIHVPSVACKSVDFTDKSVAKIVDKMIENAVESKFGNLPQVD